MVSISFVMFIGTCLPTVFSASILDSVTEDTELVFAFMVHRHGDRTPVESSFGLTGNSINITLAKEFIKPYGYGQLTDAGKRSGYKLGEFIQRRYKDLISSKYNKSEVYVRTTDSTRTKMTSLVAMSAVFPAGKDNWSRTIDWTPVPYTTVPAKYDFNLPIVNCPTFETFYYAAFTSDDSRMKSYANVIQKVSTITGVDITNFPVIIFAIYDVYVSLNSLGYDLSSDIRDIMDEMSKANDEAWDITTGNDNLLYLQAGPLLNEFFTHADKIISDTSTPKARIYSAHDFNVYSFESITRVNRQGAPKYASLYSLELRRVTATGQYVVLPVYLDDPNVGVEKYLQVEGCSGQFLCDYFEFLNITSPFILNEDTWRTKCGFSNSMTIDTSSID